MPEHPLSRTTHTLDMIQIDQLDERLAAPGAPAVTAEALGLADAADRPAGLPPTAVLTRVWWEGAPEFPYIHGTFARSGEPGGTPVHVPLHTPHLVALSHLLGLHHRWGV